MRVTNDITERGVALIDELNKVLTGAEKQKQFLLQIVKHYRQVFANSGSHCMTQHRWKQGWFEILWTPVVNLFTKEIEITYMYKVRVNPCPHRPDLV